ncbi:rod shape-determining protein MreC [Acetitomaculum ruminis DSM 5522]|uniref:Cell shape-determining protein MreC n=1 Tax=Acetitomaculum ruminis DSM 5522 TaxID=1120918 RepID=A0A1I0V542_9FIRM|nr:rod shape-determining protein MreC [Acetitomaculum ruminis]SFA71382.1 rod shape-determining protein MreC [Acetitomaculum ruminis DSM 5522]
MKKKSKFNLPGKYVLLALTVLCLTLIVITYKFDISSTPLQTVSGYIFIPVQRGINNLGLWFSDKADNLNDIKALQEENDKLKSKIEELTTQNSLLESEHYEYKRLLKLYDLGEQYANYDKVAARVIGKDSGNWFSTFIIDRGSDNGLKENMNVISDGGLVGIITKVGKNWATVKSIIDDTSNVSAMDLKTSDTCVIEGGLEQMNKNQDMIFTKMHDSDSNSQISDQIVTSNISDKYLPGILIGYITSIKDDDNGLTKTGTITPVVDFEHMQEVLVITALK